MRASLQRCIIVGPCRVVVRALLRLGGGVGVVLCCSRVGHEHVQALDDAVARCRIVVLAFGRCREVESVCVNTPQRLVRDRCRQIWLPNCTLTAPATLGVASHIDDLIGASSGIGASGHWSHGISTAPVTRLNRIHAGWSS
eukprot:959821-Prymnesium_polylepis.2